MIEILTFFAVIALIIGSLYLYYRICKWLTYDFFTETPEKTGDWVDDYLIVYGKKTLGLILLIPAAILLLILALAAFGNRNNNSGGSSSRSGDSDSGYSVYQAQVRGGTTWLNIGGTRNEDGAIRSVDYEKSRNPTKQYRVIEIRDGRNVGTIYSC